MARKRSGGDEGGGDSWLNTYADMVTLLLTFFAVLLSMSSVNQDKFNAFIKSFSNLPQEVIDDIIKGTPGDDPEGNGATPSEGDFENSMDQLYKQLTQYVEDNNQEAAVSLSKVDDVIYIRFDSAVFFEPNKYTMRKESYDVISFIGDGLKSYESQIRLITIFGHTATSSGSNNLISDWMLSGERSAVVAKYIEDEKGFDPTKLVIIGYGNNFPVADNATEDGRRQNRRVEMAIIGNKNNTFTNPYDALKDLYDNSQYPSSGGADDIVLPPKNSDSPVDEADPTVPDVTVPQAPDAQVPADTVPGDGVETSPFTDTDTE